MNRSNAFSPLLNRLANSDGAKRWLLVFSFRSSSERTYANIMLLNYLQARRDVASWHTYIYVYYTNNIMRQANKLVL